MARLASEEEEGWSGSRAPPPGGGWFDGRGFWLNELYGEELGEDDPRLTPEERGAFEASAPGGDGGAERYHVFELPVGDARSQVPQVNRGALGLSELNHDPEGLRAALFTSYDFVDDPAWLQEELSLRHDVPITLCTHCWWAQEREGQPMLADLKRHFDDVVVHFPKTTGGGTCRTFGSRHWLASSFLVLVHAFSRWRQIMAAKLLSSASSEAPDERQRGWDDWACTVHAKLILLEFADRLRVAITTANLLRTHWRFRNEAVWVQDFPRARSGDADAMPVGSAQSSQPDASRLLNGGRFAHDLSHFVADLLMRAPRGRQAAWVEVLAAFDFSGAAARLVPSLPGLFPRARAPPPWGGAALRLWVQGARSLQGRPTRASLSRTAPGAWRLHVAGDVSGVVVGRLSDESLAALAAAEELGLQVRPEVELFAGDTWDDEGGDPGAAAEGAAGARAPWLARAVVEGTCNGRWARELPALLACLEVDYGLFSLRRNLEDGLWLQEEERHYVAITSSIDWLRDNWLEDFDACVGRADSHQSLGPAVIAPSGDAPLHMSYLELDKRRKLYEHSPPWHAPGREHVPNHSKLVLRHLWDEGRGMPYGWVYVGSHNLSQWAWGSIVGDRLHGKLWVGNRELGVLLVQPRAPAGGADAGGAGGLFAGTPLPFGLPLVRADVSERECQAWGAGEEAGDESGWWPGGWEDWGGGWWSRLRWAIAGWWSGPHGARLAWEEDSDSSDSEPEAAGPSDWRLKASSNWWWAW